MSQRARKDNGKNHHRQLEYLKLGIVMLPTLDEERKMGNNSGRKLKKGGEA